MCLLFLLKLIALLRVKLPAIWNVSEINCKTGGEDCPHKVGTFSQKMYIFPFKLSFMVFQGNRIVRLYLEVIKQ